MPNRVIREGFLDSDKINSLSEKEQNFFIRIMLLVDDFGKFDARPNLLSSRCYPVSDTRQTDVSKMLTKLKEVGLIIIYTVSQKQYLQVLSFNQRTRIMKSKYPDPVDDSHLSDTCLTDDGLNPIQSKPKPKPKPKPKRNQIENSDEILFNTFRNKYPGTKKGNDTEFENFCKKHNNWKEILPQLLPFLEEQIKNRDILRGQGLFVPEWKHLQTWINQKAWEETITIPKGKKKWPGLK